jgi:hypothetical protein
MDARTVDDAARELRELRHEEWHNAVLAPLVLALSVVATQVFPPLAIPLLAGGLYLAVRFVVVEFRRYCLVEDLAEQRDAYAIPEVAERARRAATMPSRRSMAETIRVIAAQLSHERLGSCASELEGLAAELDRDDLDLDPAFAVACEQLVSDAITSPLRDPSADGAEVAWRVRHIRSGFTKRRPVDAVRSSS